MLKFWITIDTEDDAIKGDRNRELERILKEAANRISRGAADFKLMDINGNAVGQVTKCKTWVAAAEAEGFLGCTGWDVADIKRHWPNLTDDEAEMYLNGVCDHLCDLMIERGNDYLAATRPDDYEGEHEDSDDE